MSQGTMGAQVGAQQTPPALFDRRKFIGAAAAAAFAWARRSSAVAAVTTAPARSTGVELIRDSHFRLGLFLLDPKPGKRVVYGQLQGALPGAQPVWDLCQWSSKFPLEAKPPERRPGRVLRFANQAKAVTFGPPKTDDADLSLAVDATAEYGERARKQGDPWVHLLLQQEVPNPPSLARIAAASFHVSVRLKRSRQVKTADYSSGLHAAQMQMFLTLQNRNQKSPGFGESLWFGIPFYDDRHRLIPAYKAQDFGETKMYIFTCPTDAFTRQSTHDGEWVTMERDLLPLMREGMDTAWAKGFLRDSRQLADYCISGLNLGWEVPGIFDVEMQIRDLSLKIASRPGNSQKS